MGRTTAGFSISAAEFDAWNRKTRIDRPYYTASKAVRVFEAAQDLGKFDDEELDPMGDFVLMSLHAPGSDRFWNSGEDQTTVIPIADEADCERIVKVVTVELTEEEWAQGNLSHSYRAMVAREKAVDMLDEKLRDHVVKITLDGEESPSYAVDFSLKHGTTAKATPGKMRTLYYIKADEGNTQNKALLPANLLVGFESLADARAKAVEFARQNPGLTRLWVEGVQSRITEDGEPDRALVVIQNSYKRISVKARVECLVPKDTASVVSYGIFVSVRF